MASSASCFFFFSLWPLLEVEGALHLGNCKVVIQPTDFRWRWGPGGSNGLLTALQWVLAGHQVWGAFPWYQESLGFQPKAGQASSCPDVHHPRPLAGSRIRLPPHPSSPYSSFNMKPKCRLLCEVFLNWPCQLGSSHSPTALRQPQQSSSHILPHRLVCGSVTATSLEPVTCLIPKWFQTDGSLLLCGFSGVTPVPSKCQHVVGALIYF